MDCHQECKNETHSQHTHTHTIYRCIWQSTVVCLFVCFLKQLPCSRERTLSQRYHAMSFSMQVRVYKANKVVRIERRDGSQLCSLSTNSFVITETLGKQEICFKCQEKQIIIMCVRVCVVQSFNPLSECVVRMRELALFAFCLLLFGMATSCCYLVRHTPSTQLEWNRFLASSKHQKVPVLFQMNQ